MAKYRPGIPANFSLDVAPVQDLGDYLDEPGLSPLPTRKQQESPARESAHTHVMRPPVRPEAAQNTDPLPVTPPLTRRLAQAPVETLAPARTRTESISSAEAHDRPPRLKGPRREFNMTQDSLRMVDELLDLLRSGSGQRDTKANELFHGLLLLVHEARGEIDPHALPKRGRWGTPTARAYPLEIRNAFLSAILKKYGGRP